MSNPRPVASRAPCALAGALALLVAAPALAQLTGIGAQYWEQGLDGLGGASEVNDTFGFALATGDFNCDGFADLAIGAPYEDVTGDCDGDGTPTANECHSGGAVTVIYGSAQGLHVSLQEADEILTQNTSGVPGAPERGDHFGWALASMRVPGSSCDDLAVGVPGEDVTDGPLTHVDAGIVQYFRGGQFGLVADGQFVQGRDGVPDTSDDDDRFGSALAEGPGVIGNDVDECNPNGSAATLLIGAPGEDVTTGGDDEGAVYVVVAPCDLSGAGGGDLPSHFNCSALSPSADCQRVTSGQPQANARAGAAVAGWGNPWLGTDFLASGVPGEDFGPNESGFVDIWMSDAATGDGDFRWERSCAQGWDGAPGLAQADDELGTSLAIGYLGDYDELYLAAGVPYEDVANDAIDDAGAVSVFYADLDSSLNRIYPTGGGSPASQVFTESSLAGVTAQAGDRFGTALAVGDFDDDGQADLAVGAPGRGGSKGLVGVLYATAGGLTTTGSQAFDLSTTGIPGSPQAGDYFGKALAAGDFDGDGRADLAIGAPGDTLEDETPGGVFVLYGGVGDGYLDEVVFETASPVTEGNSRTISVTRSGSARFTLDVDYAIQAGGTAIGGTDYQMPSGTLHWNAGERGTKTFSLVTIEDAVDEPNETVVLNLDSSDYWHCRIGESMTVTINDDDANVPGTVSFSSSGQTRREDQTATVTVNRAGGTTPVTIRYATAEGTAHANFDYVPTSGTLAFALDETSKTFDVTLVDDALHEAVETLTVSLGLPGGGVAIGAPSVHTVSISDGPNGDTGMLADGFESGNLKAWF
jgi:hypothetical protein